MRLRAYTEGVVLKNLLLILLFTFVFIDLARADLPLDYQELSAIEKLDILWNENLVPNEYNVVPEIQSLGLFDLVKLMSKSFLAKSFDHESDEMPEGRVKLLHPFGSVVKVEFIPSPKANTSGLLKSGAMGIARLSLAGNPNLMGYTPGMGLKLLVDGKPSVNLHVMNSLSGQDDDQNFFALEFSNILPKPPFYLTLLAQAFTRVKSPPTELNVNGIARVNSSGELVKNENIKNVYQIVFRPNPALAIASDTQKDFREELSQIPSGSTLYSVFTRRHAGSNLVKVGYLVTRSEFVASRYGDENLFFQHQR